MPPFLHLLYENLKKLCFFVRKKRKSACPWRILYIEGYDIYRGV